MPRPTRPAAGLFPARMAPLQGPAASVRAVGGGSFFQESRRAAGPDVTVSSPGRSEEHTSELQSRQYLTPFPPRRSSDPRVLVAAVLGNVGHSRLHAAPNSPRGRPVPGRDGPLAGARRERASGGGRVLLSGEPSGRRTGRDGEQSR